MIFVWKGLSSLSVRLFISNLTASLPIEYPCCSTEVRGGSEGQTRFCFFHFLLMCVKKIAWNENFYCTRVNLRLNPKFVFEVGKVLATKGLFMV